MTAASERGRPAGLGLPLLFAALFVIMRGPVGLITLPFAALLWTARDKPSGWMMTTALAGGISLWWLIQPGDPAEQMARAAAVIGCAAYVILARMSRFTATHRSIAATSLATVAVAALTNIIGPSWEAVRWWVEHKAGAAAQISLMALWTRVARRPDGLPEAGQDTFIVQMEEWVDAAIPLLVDYHPTILAFQLAAGLVLATVLTRRLGVPVGASPVRFADFRFSEHLGWVAVAALTVVLLGPEGAVRLLGVNLLAGCLGLYALRGLGVAWFGLTRRGTPHFVTVTLLVLAMVFLFLAFLVWAIILGIADSGLDLRRRWTTPRLGT